MQTPAQSSETATAEPQDAAAELTLSLTCPDCGATGRVSVRGLRQGIRCKRCNAQFHLARTGRLRVDPGPSAAGLKCPRCRHGGSVVVQPFVQDIRCPLCELPLLRGPDGRFHGLNQCEALWAEHVAAQRRVPRIVRWLTAGGRLAPGAAAAIVAGLLLAGVGVFVAAAVLTSWLRDESPEARAERLAFACLSGERDAPLEYVEDDDVQRAEFPRWRVRHFASIIDRLRPDGDDVEIEIVSQGSELDVRHLKLTLVSPFLGRRSHDQIWRERDGQWWFDVTATLAAEAGRKPRSPQGASR